MKFGLGEAGMEALTAAWPGQMRGPGVGGLPTESWLSWLPGPR